MRLLVFLIICLSLHSWAQPNQTTTACCLCTEKGTLDNNVRPYVSQDACEGQSNLRGIFSQCRRVEVLGTSCSFMNVKMTRGELSCTTNLLQYKESNELKTIAPPPGPFGPCANRILSGGLQGMGKLDLASEKKDSDTTKTQAERRDCSCGTNPNNPDQCILFYRQSEKMVTLNSADRPHGTRGCSQSVCQDLFAADIAQCTLYRQ